MTLKEFLYFCCFHYLFSTALQNQVLVWYTLLHNQPEGRPSLCSSQTSSRGITSSLSCPHLAPSPSVQPNGFHPSIQPRLSAVENHHAGCTVHTTCSLGWPPLLCVAWSAVHWQTAEEEKTFSTFFIVLVSLKTLLYLWNLVYARCWIVGHNVPRSTWIITLYSGALFVLLSAAHVRSVLSIPSHTGHW